MKDPKLPIPIGKKKVLRVENESNPLVGYNSGKLKRNLERSLSVRNSLGSDMMSKRRKIEPLLGKRKASSLDSRKDGNFEIDLNKKKLVISDLRSSFINHSMEQKSITLMKQDENRLKVEMSDRNVPKFDKRMDVHTKPLVTGRRNTLPDLVIPRISV